MNAYDRLLESMSPDDVAEALRTKSGVQPTPKSSGPGDVWPAEIKIWAVVMHVGEEHHLRDIGYTLGVSHETIRNWVQKCIDPTFYADGAGAKMQIAPHTGIGRGRRRR